MFPFKRKPKHEVLIFNDQNMIDHEIAYLKTSTTIETKSGEILLCQVEGKPYNFRGKTYTSYIRRNKEPFVRDWRGKATTSSKILYFIRKHKLYIDVTKDYNVAYKKNPDFQEFTYSADKTKLKRSDIIVLESGEKIYPFSVSENDYLRTELDYMQQNKIIKGLIRHMSRDADSMKKDMLMTLIYVGAIVIVVFLMNGGLKTII